MLLSGCFVLHQSFTVNDGSTASYEMNLESNGEISDDARTATRELPLSVALAEQEVYEFRAVASYSVPWYQKALNWLRFW